MATADAEAVRRSIEALDVDIYEPLTRHPELLFTTAQLEEVLNERLAGQTFTGPIRTRSKLAKEAVCRALGYPVPAGFRRTQPRFPGQDLDVYVQQHNNLQVWNEEVVPTRRYAVLKVDSEGGFLTARIIEGTDLAILDPTGTLTSKYQAKRRGPETGSVLVSETDTDRFVEQLDPGPVPAEILEGLVPTNRPERGSVLPIRELFDRLGTTVGKDLPYVASERIRGENFHRLVCEVLGLGSYADSGAFPDIVCQALEVKLQTAGTIDLGLVRPDSTEPAITLSPLLRHCDVRYAIAYAARSENALRIESVVIAPGEAFFAEFQPFGGLVQNRKLQIHLPNDFFHSK